MRILGELGVAVAIKVECLDELDEVALVTVVGHHRQRPGWRPVRLVDMRRENADREPAHTVVIVTALDRCPACGLAVRRFEIGG